VRKLYNPHVRAEKRPAQNLQFAKTDELYKDSLTFAAPNNKIISLFYPIRVTTRCICFNCRACLIKTCTEQNSGLLILELVKSDDVI
jgi:hypothetical protein